MNKIRLLFAVGVVALAACGGAQAEHSSTRGDRPPLQRVKPRGSGHDWTRFGWDAGRSSSSSDATGVSASNIGRLTRQQVTLDGTVDASPIYLHGVSVNGSTRDVLFVTTTYGKTIAIDADSGAVLWRFTPSSYSALSGSRQITTATPVADPGRDFIYAASPDGRIQKLSVADGHAVWSTAITSLPKREKIASSLNYFRGHVIAVTGGYIGDAPPYQGHVSVLDAESGKVLQTWNSLCSDRHQMIDPASCSESGSAIWGRGAPVIDSGGNIYVATGNGTWDGVNNWGDAVIELDPSASRIVDNYTPANTEALNARDADVGSSSPALLGGGFIAQGGKDGTIRVIQFGATRGNTPRRGGEQQIVKTPSGTDLFSTPAFMHSGSATWVFAADNGGTAAWTLSGGQLHAAWSNRNGGTSPVVAGGLLYVYDPDGGLRVYEPQTGKQVAVLECGGGHWNSPIVVDGMVILPEGNANQHKPTGILDIWRTQ